MQKKGRTLGIVLSLALALIAIPVAKAQLSGTVRNAFQYFFSWMQIESIMFGLTFIFLLILFYGIFAAGLSRVTVFHEGDKVNRYGKMVALSFAVLADMGLLFVLGSSPGDSMRNVLTAMGTFAAIAFSLLVFGISYMNFKGGEKTWPLVFLTTGLGMVVFGLLTDGKSWFSFGWLFIIIGIVWFILSGNRSESKGGSIPENEIGGWTPKTRRPIEEISEEENPAEKELEKDKTGIIRGRVIDATMTLSLPNSVHPSDPARILVNPSTKGIVHFVGDGRVYVKRHGDEQVIATGMINPANGLFQIDNVPMVKDAIVFVRSGGKVVGSHITQPFGRPGDPPEKFLYVNLIKNNPETNVIVSANPPEKEFYSLNDNPHLRNHPPRRPIEPTGKDPGKVTYDDLTEADEEEQKRIRERSQTIKKYTINHPKITKDGRIFLSPNLSCWFPEVENQGPLKACTCYAGGSLFEFLKGFELNRPLAEYHLSKPYLFYMLHGNTDNKGSTSILSPLLKFEEGGCCRHQFYTPEQYISRSPPGESASHDAPRQKIKEIMRVSEDPDDWVRILCDMRPIYIAIAVDDGFTGFNGLVYPEKGKVAHRKGWHAVIIVAYRSMVSDGKSKPGPAFLIRNSWGDDWGANGYAWIYEDYLKDNLWELEPPFVVLEKQESSGVELSHTSPRTEREIIDLIQRLRDNMLPEGESLGWHDENKEAQLKIIMDILDRLDRHAAILGTKKGDLDKMTASLKKFLTEVEDSYSRGMSTAKLKGVSDARINRYLEDIADLFLNSTQIADFRVDGKIR